MNKTDKYYLNFIKQYPYRIVEIPKRLQTRKMWIDALNDENFNYVNICFIDIDFLDEEFINLVPEKYRLHLVIDLNSKIGFKGEETSLI